MAKVLQTIYEYLSDYSEEEINNMINELSEEDKMLITERYGGDLHNPSKREGFGSEKSKLFYGTLIPRMKKILSTNRENNLNLEKEINLRKTLISLINSQSTNKAICETLNISYEQLYSLLLELKNKGLMVLKKYYSDGLIRYKAVNNFTDVKSLNYTVQDRTIITDYNDKKFRFLALSDLHFGNELERKDLVDRSFDYCSKNGINIILCCGDIIDGTYTHGTQRISDSYEQAEYFIKNYPFDKNILTFAVAGDHDLSAFLNNGLNIIELCNNYRPDIVIGGYNNSVVNIKDDKILLFHHTSNGEMRRTNAPIILHGHSHQYRTYKKFGALNIDVPSISNINQPFPSVLDINIDFDSGLIDKTNIKQIYFDNKDVVISDIEYELLKDRKVVKSLTIPNQELFKNR